MSADCRLTVTVRPARGADEIEAAQRLRLLVFVDEQGVDREEELDGFDDAATHIVAVDEKDAGPGREAEEPAVVIATCRLRFDGRDCKLERMAVSERLRGHGVGARLLAGAEGEARDRGASRMILNSQASAEGFYAAAGYEAEAERFMEAGIEHVRMTKTLGGAG